MENQEMKITPQDIIDKEFRVKFRGFDMAEVDAFLEEVAENFFRLAEENTLLNEKILALEQELETGGLTGLQGQLELPAELGSLLEDLKQDTTAIGAELTTLKQDRQIFDSLEKNIKDALSSLQELAAAGKSQEKFVFPAEFVTAMEGVKQDSAAVASELAALKQERQDLNAIKTNFEEIAASARKAASITASGENQDEISAGLGKTLENVKEKAESIEAELASMKDGLGSLPGMREEIKNEVQSLLASHFEKLEAKLSGLNEAASQVSPAPAKKETLLAAEVIEEPEGHQEEAALPNYRPDEDEAEEEGELEFLSEDDILDVDKLRNIFQSVLDEGISEGYESRDGDEASADLLFLEDELIEDDHEPKVTFSLEESATASKSKFRKP